MSGIINRLEDLLVYLFSMSGLWIWGLAILALTIFLYVRPQSFWLNDVVYRFPLIGKLARYSTDFAEQKPGGWRNVEHTLCQDYARYATSLSQREFDGHVEYLRKAQDIGRRPMPVWATALITGLVIFEGLAFAYILGSWISIDSSENERILFMLAVVAVLAVLLVIVTHAAGRQMYRTKLLKACFRAWKETRSKEYFTRIVSLAEDQSVDDKELPYVQCTNRVVSRHGDFGSNSLVLLALAFIAVIAVGSTVLRIKTLQTSNDAELLANVFGGSPTASPHDNTAAFVSFAILATIFVVTQLVAISFGYKYSFAGRESANAYDSTGGHPNYRSYWRTIQHRMNIANSRLQSLQRLLERQAGPIDWHRDFFDYVREARARGNTNLHEPPHFPEDPDPVAQPGPPAEEAPGEAGNITPFERGSK